MNDAARKTTSDDGGKSLAKLYEPDETAWLDASSRLIRDGRFDELDYKNLASYLDDMAKSERREVEHRLEVLIEHLLKWQFQSNKRTPSWKRTVVEQRQQLIKLLTKTLRRHVEDVIAECYRGGVELAAAETNLPKHAFPATCPFTLDQILTEELA